MMRSGRWRSASEWSAQAFAASARSALQGRYRKIGVARSASQDRRRRTANDLAPFGPQCQQSSRGAGARVGGGGAGGPVVTLNRAVDGPRTKNHAMISEDCCVVRPWIKRVDAVSAKRFRLPGGPMRAVETTDRRP